MATIRDLALPFQIAETDGVLGSETLLGRSLPLTCKLKVYIVIVITSS
jgi:hypothetical protein